MRTNYFFKKLFPLLMILYFTCASLPANGDGPSVGETINYMNGKWDEYGKRKTSPVDGVYKNIDLRFSYRNGFLRIDVDGVLVRGASKENKDEVFTINLKKVADVEVFKYRGVTPTYSGYRIQIGCGGAYCVHIDSNWLRTRKRAQEERTSTYSTNYWLHERMLFRAEDAAIRVAKAIKHLVSMNKTQKKELF